jgi:CheY-like chemotaxis protein
MSAACDGYVVLVDDEEDTRELLRDLLEAQGFQVATAEDGAKALDVMSTVPRVCLVLVDLLMPVMDGFELLRRLAADPKLSTFPVWVSTSAPEKAPQGVPCLPKPVDIERLLALVRQHCVARGGA